MGHSKTTRRNTDLRISSLHYTKLLRVVVSVAKVGIRINENKVIDGKNTHVRLFMASSERLNPSPA
jgi:hypothetical protein